jgi:NADH dehydrogenase FAD-containing subunit
MANREARGGTLIVGGGFAGSYVARKLGRRGATIVSPENFILFTAMLPEAASGTLEPRHVFGPLRIPLLSRKLRVVTDWTVALFFRRDIAELGVLEQPRRLDG